MILCTTCSKEIPEKRLRAIPNARQCVSCIENAGDVPLLKRFDEPGADGEVTSTIYTNNSYIASQQQRVAYTNNPEHDEMMDFLYTRPVDNIKGYSMSEAFEEDEED